MQAREGLDFLVERRNFWSKQRPDYPKTLGGGGRGASSAGAAVKAGSNQRNAGDMMKQGWNSMAKDMVYRRKVSFSLTIDQSWANL